MTVLAGHHDVQHKQIERVLSQLPAHFRAIGRAFHRETVLAEIIGQKIADVDVVVHDQEAEAVAVTLREGRSIRHGVSFCWMFDLNAEEAEEGGIRMPRYYISTGCGHAASSEM